jgi:hypothetical protein
MSEDRWFDNYDFEVLFPTVEVFEEDGIYYGCKSEDVLEGACWTSNEETDELCTYEGECFSTEETIRIFFEGFPEDDEWEHEEYEIPESEWFHNMMSDIGEGIKKFYPFEAEDEYGVMWNCDEPNGIDSEYGWCVRYEESTNEICERHDECYSSE